MIQPTRLYVKIHRRTGLKYFGKTCREDIVSYSGSGTYWKRHCEKHGFDIDTEWVSEWFTDEDDIMEFALFFSEFHDIVKSDIWANLMNEDGLTGSTLGRTVSLESRERMSTAQTGRTQSDVFCDSHSQRMHQDDVKAYMRLFNIEKDVSQSTRIKLSEAGKHRTQNSETRKKISKSRIGFKAEDSTRIIQSLVRSGSSTSNETKAKISLSNTGKVQSSEVIQKKAQNRNKPIHCDGLVFENVKTAAVHFNTKEGTIRRRLSSRLEMWNSWFYVIDNSNELQQDGLE